MLCSPENDRLKLKYIGFYNYLLIEYSLHLKVFLHLFKYKWYIGNNDICELLEEHFTEIETE
jgi:hypothetical protein